MKYLLSLVFIVAVTLSYAQVELYDVNNNLVTTGSNITSVLPALYNPATNCNCRIELHGDISDFDITPPNSPKNVTIIGVSAQRTINGAGLGRILNLNGYSGSYHLENLILTGGYAHLGQGGAIQANNSTLSLLDVNLEANESPQSGGAISAFGSDVSLHNVTMLGNVSAEAGGGLVMLNTSLVIGDVEVFDNEAVLGGGIYASHNSTIIADPQTSLQVGNNSASMSDGGVVILNGSMASFESFTSSNNTSRGPNGGLNLENSDMTVSVFIEVNDNQATLLPGISLDNSLLSIDGDGTVERNIASAGVSANGTQLHVHNYSTLTVRPFTQLVTGNNSSQEGHVVIRDNGRIDIQGWGTLKLYGNWVNFGTDAAVNNPISGSQPAAGNPNCGDGKLQIIGGTRTTNSVFGINEFGILQVGEHFPSGGMGSPACQIAPLPISFGSINFGNNPTEIDIKEGFIISEDITFIDPNAKVTLLSTPTLTAYFDDFIAPAGTVDLIGELHVQRYIAQPASGGGMVKFYGTPVHTLNNPGQLDIQELSELDLNQWNGSDGDYVDPDPSCSINFTTSDFGNVQEFDEQRQGAVATQCSDEHWMVRKAGNIEVAKGYATYHTQPHTMEVVGAPNTGNISIPLTFNTNASVPSAAGWNLISNPYPSPIDLDHNFGNQYKTYYMWSSLGTTQQNPNYGCYVIYNNITTSTSHWCSGTSQTPSYGDLPDLAHSQGFFVYSLGNETFNFYDGTRLRDDAHYFKESAPWSHIKISVSNPDGYIDEILFGESDLATKEVNPEIDALKALNGMLHPELVLAIDIDQTLYSHKWLQDLSQLPVIPLHLTTQANGIHSLDLSFEGFENRDVYLKDVTTNTYYDLSEAVDLHLDKGEYGSRFSIVFDQNLEVSEHLQIASNDGSTVVSLLVKDELTTGIALYSLSGQLIEEQPLDDQSKAVFNTSTLFNGIYMVKAIGGANHGAKKLAITN